jgi:integrase
MARRAKGEGCLMRRPGSRVWYAQWYKDGVAVRKSTHKTIKEEALPVLRKLMGDTERGVPLADGKLRYTELRSALIDNYVTKGNKTLEQRADGTETIVGLPQLDKAAGYSADDPGMLVSKITTEWTRKFMRDRAAEGAGNAMINRSLQALRRGLNILREDGKVAVVPKIRLLKEPKARKGFLEQQKFEELLAALPGYLRPLIALLYWTGVRLGEALQIEWSQVDLSTRTIWLEDEQTKGEEPRVLPLPSVVVAMLHQIEPKTGNVFDGSNLRTEWETTCAAVGLGTRVKVKGASGYTWHKYTGLRLHDMRRSAVRNLVRAGVSQKVAMDISGHKTVDVFLRYNITSTTDVLAAMRQVEVAAAKALPAKKRVGRALKGKLSVQSGRKSL